MRSLGTVLLALVIASCAMPNRVNVLRNGEVDTTQKVVMVPGGSFGLLGVAKQVLSEKGWRTVALAGPSKTVGSIDQGKVNLEQYTEASARYILNVTEQFINYECYPNFNDYAGVPQTSHFRYSVSFVDWRSGAEVLTIAGQGCLYDIVNNLKENIP